MTVKIETERLIIREYRQDDWADVHEYSQDPEVSRFMLWGPNSPEQTRDFIAKMLGQQKDDPRWAFEFAVESKESGGVIGGIGLRIKSVEKRTADLGYCYHRLVWGKGYGSEAAQGMLKFGFETLRLHRVWATCDAENLGSAGIMRKNGMVQEAHFRLDELIKGRWRDTLLYAMLEDEWRALANSAEHIVCTT